MVNKPFAVNESELIIQCQRNNKEAQRTLFESNFQMFMSVCMRYSKNKAQAEEMLNDSYAYLLANINQFTKSEQNFSDWAREAFVTNAVRFLKSKKNEYYVASTVKVSDEKTAATDLFNSIPEQDFREPDGTELLKAIQTLPPSFRATYNMNVVDGFDLKRTGEVLEISEDTAKFNLEKANYQLQQIIKQYQKGYR